MANLGDLVVRIVGDNTDLDKSIDRSESKLKRFGDQATRIGKSLTTAVTLPILGVGAAFVKAASDAEETNSKFNAVFKEQSAEVRDWAKTFSDSVGRSTTANIGFLATIQDTLVPLGFMRDRAAEMSKATVTLATDLASFNNLPTEQVVRDIQSALVGNTETLRKYGVVASQEAIVQEALNSGLIETKDQLDATSKAQAIYNLLLNGTVDAQGDAVRTAGSTANQFRALKADVEDLAISFGQELIPFVKDMVAGARELTGWFTDLDRNTKNIIITVAGLAAAMGPLALAIGGVSTAMKALVAPPTGWIVLAVAALTTLATVVLNVRRRYKEWQDQLHNTAEAMAAMTEEEQRQLRLKIAQELAEERREQLENIRIMRENQERLNDLVDKYGEQGARMRQEFGLALGQVDSATKAFERNGQKIDELTKALEEADEVLAGDFRPEVQDMTTDVEELGDAATGAEEQYRLLAESWGAGADAAEELRDAHRRLRASLEREDGSPFDPMSAARASDGGRSGARTGRGRAEEREAFIAEQQALAEELVRITQERIAMQDELEDGAYFENIERMRNVYATQKQEAQEYVDWYKENYIDKITDNSQQMFDTLVGFANTLADAEIAAIERSALSEEEKDARILQIKQRQARRNKALGIFNATIDTAQAIVGFLKDPGGTVGIILSAIAAATGAAQIASIAAQPIPQLAEGGVVTGPTQAVIGEGGVPEAVIPLDQLGSVLAEFPGLAGKDEGMMHVTVQMDSKPILDSIFPATRDRRVLVDARSIV